MPDEVRKLLKKLTSVKTAGVEDSISVRNFRRLKKTVKTRLKSLGPLIEFDRQIKDQREVQLIRRAGQIAHLALERVLSRIRVGMTESELAGMLDLEIRRLNAANSFETIAAFGPSASRPHHIPGSRKLRKNDTILLDFGAVYQGYCSDITRCFYTGRLSSEYKKAYQAVLGAQEAALSEIKPGVDVKQPDKAARRVIKNYNLPVFGHGTGHGIGLNVHESPTVSPRSTGKFTAGMVFTVEPGIYIPGKFGIRIEDDVLVTDSGCQVLTSPRFRGLARARLSG